MNEKNDLLLTKLFRSVMEQDRAPIVICDLASVIVYMNAAAIAYYKADLTGSDLKKCHNAESNEKIDRVLAWFAKSLDNNVVYTYHNEKQNKDVYMIALRDTDGTLLGYYEKHEYRNPETAERYRI